jgi:glyoxylase I family protein
MLKLNGVHHIAIICSDYLQSKDFYTKILGLDIIRETYRQERNSYKLDLALNGRFIIELFSFTNPPERVTGPEAAGLRHLAFEVDNIDEAYNFLSQNNREFEPVRVDQLTGKRFIFFKDPDDLPIEFYEK